MKVGLVSPYDLGRPGGVQDQVIRLSGWLRDAGYDVVIVGPGTEGPDHAILLGAAAVVPANRAKTPIRLDPRVGRQLTAALADVDVIHVHEPLMPAVSPAALRVEGPAKVATFHADPPRWVRSLYRHGRSGVRFAVRNAAVITAVSPVAGSSIDGVVEYRIIPNGINVARYDTGPKIQGRVAFLGRDDERKGLAVLLNAWAAVRAAVPGATLSVLGATRDEPVSGVEFFGRVGDEVKEAELGAASVFCAPNLGGESFGIIVAEAMASGCAIVASSIPAFEHVAGPSARFVAPGDSAELAQQIIGLLLAPDTAAQLGETAAERVRRFDGSSVATDYIVAYEDAIAGS
jgi:phosphatidylinositol alpha-mannosyltransferase